MVEILGRGAIRESMEKSERSVHAMDVELRRSVLNYQGTESSLYGFSRRAKRLAGEISTELWNMGLD